MLIKIYLLFSKFYIFFSSSYWKAKLSKWLTLSKLTALSIQVRLNETLSCHKGALCFFCGWHCITYSLCYPLMNSLYYKWDYALFEYQVVLMHKTRMWRRGKVVFIVNALSHLTGCQVFSVQQNLGSSEHSFGNESVFLPTPTAFFWSHYSKNE